MSDKPSAKRAQEQSSGPAQGLLGARRCAAPRPRRPPRRLRHDAARRRAVAGHLSRRRREARDRRAAGPGRRRLHRGRVPRGQPGGLRGRADDRPLRGHGRRRPGHLRPVAHAARRRRPLLGGGARCRPVPHPRVHLDEPAAHGAHAQDERGPGAGRDPGRREPGPGAHRRRGVQPPGRHQDAARLHAGGAAGVGRSRRHHAEHPRHRGLRHPLGLRRPHPVHPQGDPGRLRPVDPLPQRPGAGHGQHLGRRAGRGPPGRGVRQRARREGRQRRSRGGRHGPEDPRPISSPASRRRCAPRSWRAPRGSWRGSPAIRCSTTRPSSGATPSPTSRASISTACWPTAPPTRSSTPPASGRWAARSSWASTRVGTPSPATLEKMGIHVQGDGLNQAFTRFKELADRKVEITEADLEAIVAEELGQDLVEGFHLEALEVAGGTVGMPRARVVVSRSGDKVEAAAEGNGMIDAACTAIRAATKVESPPHRLQRVVGDGRGRRPRRRRRAARGRRAQGVGTRRVHRRRRSLGPRLSGCGQPPRAHPGPQRAARRGDRPLSAVAAPRRPSLRPRSADLGRAEGAAARPVGDLAQALGAVARPRLGLLAPLAPLGQGVDGLDRRRRTPPPPGARRR